MSAGADSATEPGSTVAELPQGFHMLTVAAVRPLTPDASEVAFSVPDKLRESFQFQPGQHLTLRRMVNGDEIRRNYSLTCRQVTNEVTVGVRRIEGGIMSCWLLDEVAAGDEIAVMEPTGRFVVDAAAPPGGAWLFVAAGSGITPMMSLIPSILDGDPAARVTLLYGNRGVETIMFRDELADLKDRYLTRLSVQHFLSREQRRAGMLDGRIDAAAIARLPALGVDPGYLAGAFVCGPPVMIDAVRDALAAAGTPADRVHAELFDTTGAASSRPRPAPDADVTCEATVQLHGIGSTVGIRENETILDACTRAGLDVPFSCTGGVCATCRAHVSEGETHMGVNYALTEAELAAGYTLTCQATVTSDTAAVDFDRA